MSFAATVDQVLDGSKTVTRRDGWKSLKRGDQVWAVKKSMGLKKGEKVERLALLDIVAVRFEQLEDVTDADVALEGFPGKDREWFIEFYRHLNGLRPEQDVWVTRIEFRHAEPEAAPERQPGQLFG